MNSILNDNEIGIVYKKQIDKEQLEELSKNYTVVSIKKYENNEYTEEELKNYFELFKEHFYDGGIVNCPYVENNLVVDNLLLVPKTNIVSEY